MAKSTLAKSASPHRFVAEVTRPRPSKNSAKSVRNFVVFPTGTLGYPWHVVTSSTHRTISRHKSLRYALRKCSRLNERCAHNPIDPFAIALSGFADVNSYRAYYQGVSNDCE